MYTSIVDILEGLTSNHSVNPLHFVQALLDLLANSDPVDMTITMGHLINKVNRPIILHMADVKELIKFYVDLLYRPIGYLMNLLHAAYGTTQQQVNPIQAFLPTISAFESLLTASMFSGNTWSFIPRFLYGRATENRLSLELLKAIKTLNRLDFSGELWLVEEEMINGTAEMMNDLILRFRIANIDRAVESFALIMKINSYRRAEDVAKTLWMSYFDFLYRIFPDDVLPNVPEAFLSR